MAKCMCRSMPLASSSSALFRNGAPFGSSSSSVMIASGKCPASRIIAAHQEATGNGVHGLAKTSCRRRFLSLGLLTATGLAAGLTAPRESNAQAEATSVSKCFEFTVAPSGLAFCDLSLGSGIQAEKGMLIKAHYTGKLENGTVFDSSYKRGKPLTFRVGVGEVIRGWDQGLAGADGIPAMLAGGKRTLRIPSKLAYGERGAGCRGGSCLIPPNSTLIFDVEFVGKA